MGSSVSVVVMGVVRVRAGGGAMVVRADAVLQERQARESEAREDSGGDPDELASTHGRTSARRANASVSATRKTAGR